MSRCPDIAVLRSLEAGALREESADEIIPHVQNCSVCSEALERFRSEDLDARVLRSALGDRGSITHDGQASTIVVDTGGVEVHGIRSGESSIVWDIPDYERVRMCGSGAFGTVWAVRDRLGLHRALKTIDMSRLRSANVRCRESTALEAYCRRVQRHRNLIQIFHVGMQGSLLYYTMELADDDGTRKSVRQNLPANYRPLTLDCVMAKGPSSPETAIEVVLRLLRGLSRLHAMGLAHRDIKPANIIFVDRQPKLADIGMITANTQSPSQVGTPDYMPPDGKMDETSDNYAMGRVLHKMLAGAEWAKFPKLPPEVHGSSVHWDMNKIEQVLTVACAANAVDRYATADCMIEAIEAARELSYDSLFTSLAPMANARPAGPKNEFVPIAVAAINALPWICGAIIALVLINRFL